MPTVGTSPPRTDGAAKVTGQALYIDDYVHPGALYGATVRSNVARGNLRSVTLDPSFDWTGITVVTAKELPGENVVDLIADDQPILATDSIRHMYEPIALLAADSPERLAQALGRVHVQVDPLPPVLTMNDALAAHERIYGDDNIFKRYAIEHRLDGRSIDEHLETAEVVLTERYSVPHQEHLYIEPNGMIAWWDAEGVHVTGSLQCPYYVHKAMKRAFALSGDSVHVTQAITGGGFGGKEEYPSLIGIHAALLARASGKPVRMIYGRKEDIEATTKRHPAQVEITTGSTRDGKLLTLKVNCVMDGGAYITLTPVVLSRGVLHAAGAYEWQHARIEGRAVATNTPPNGAFRGFGAPQTIWAIERHMDRLAEKLGMNPLALRKKNLLRIGSTTCTGQVLRESVGVEECIERATSESDYFRKCVEYIRSPADASSRKRRGVGVSVFLHGAGFTGSGERRLKGTVKVDLEKGGRLRVRSASTDIGQGTETVFRQLAADAAGISLGDVEVEQPSTTHVPDSGPTVASRTVMVVGSIVEKAAKDVAACVRAKMSAGESFAQAGDALLANGEVSATVVYEPPVTTEWNDETYQGDAYPTFSWGCDIAEVEVDLDTFETSVLGFWAAQDVGKAIHPVMCAGQIEGGTLQAVGWALFENVVWKEGRIMNPRMTNYVIPTSMDAPTFKTILVEQPFSGGPNGAKGVGELPMDGGAPAIAAAVEQAIGVHCNDLPLLPESLLRAVERTAQARG